MDGERRDLLKIIEELYEMARRSGAGADYTTEELRDHVLAQCGAVVRWEHNDVDRIGEDPVIDR